MQRIPVSKLPFDTLLGNLTFDIPESYDWPVVKCQKPAKLEITDKIEDSVEFSAIFQRYSTFSSPGAFAQPDRMPASIRHASAIANSFFIRFLLALLHFQPSDLFGNLVLPSNHNTKIARFGSIVNLGKGQNFLAFVVDYV